MERALAALSAREFERAAEDFAALLRERPDLPQAVAGLGLCLHELGRHEQALPCLAHAAAGAEPGERVQLAHLLTLLQLDDFDGAIRAGQALVASGAERSPAMQAQLRRVDGLMRGRLGALAEMERGHLGTLQQSLPVLLAAMPRWAMGWALKAAVQFQYSARLGPALDAAREASSAPLEASLRAARDQDLNECLLDAERALVLDPSNGLAMRYRLRARFDLGLEIETQLLPVLAGAEEQRGFGWQGPLALRNGWTHASQVPADGRLTQAAEAIEVEAPLALGADFEAGSGVGRSHSNPGYLLHLRHARVRGRSDGVCTADGIVLNDVLAHPLGVLANPVHDRAVLLRAHRQLLLRQPMQALEQDGVAVSLLGVSTRQYGHWLLEHLPRLRHLESHPKWGRARFLVDEGMPATHHQALALLLGREPETVLVPEGAAVRVEQLLHSGSDVFFPHYCHASVTTSVHIAPAFGPGLDYLRTRMAARIDTATAPRRRLFVRRTTGLRALLNQDELAQHLVQRWGFEIVEPERLDFAAQMRLFRSAAVVVGPNGSGLTNAFVCRPGSWLLTLCSEHAGNFPAWAAALKRLDVRSLFVVGRAEANSHGVRHHWNYRVDLALLDQALRERVGLD